MNTRHEATWGSTEGRSGSEVGEGETWVRTFIMVSTERTGEAEEAGLGLASVNKSSGLGLSGPWPWYD